MQPYVLFLLGFGATLLLAAWLPLALRKAPLSLPIICLSIGYGVFASGWPGFESHPLLHRTAAERLSELVVIVSLMGAGLKLNRPLGRRAWASTWRLLLIAMPLTIGAATLVGTLGLGMPLATALLFAAALSPTDPVLASDVQVQEPDARSDGEVRFALTSEAGLNDGLAFPFVHLAIVFAVAATLSDSSLPDGITLGKWFLMDVVWRLAAGVGVGWLLGRGLGWFTFDMPRARLSGTRDGLVALAATFIAYASAELIRGYGFIAVFVTALVLRNHERHHEYHEALHDFVEQTERLLLVVLLPLFGGAIAGGLFGSITIWDVLFAAGLVLVVRPMTAWLALLGLPAKRRERWLIAFFGIRGLGSFYYVAYGLNHGPFEAPDRLWAVTGLAVALSVVIHGVTATPLMRRLERTGPPIRRTSATHTR